MIVHQDFFDLGPVEQATLICSIGDPELLKHSSNETLQLVISKAKNELLYAAQAQLKLNQDDALQVG